MKPTPHPHWTVGYGLPLVALIGNKPFWLDSEGRLHTLRSNNMTEIKADTSLYTAAQDRVLAAAECIKAQRAGKSVQSRRRFESREWQAGPNWSCSDLHTLDYRVKPEPVVAHKAEYRLRVNIRLSDYGDQTVFPSRSEALKAAALYAGPVAIDEEHVRLEDGKEVSRKVYKAVEA